MVDFLFPELTIVLQPAGAVCWWRGVTDCHIGCVSAAFLPFSNKKPIYNFLNTLPAECLVNDTYFDYLHL